MSGVSGTGVIAEGCEFTSGYCSLTWLSSMGTFAWYTSIAALLHVHSHDGRTRVVWDDPDPDENKINGHLKANGSTNGSTPDVRAA